jgi:hypothetical protein
MQIRLWSGECASAYKDSDNNLHYERKTIKRVYSSDDYNKRATTIRNTKYK